MSQNLPKFNRLIILYGSETGNAQDLAKIVAWTVSSKIRHQNNKQNLSIRLMSCDEYPIQELPDESGLVLFICSTTGVGEEPQNMKRFWRFLLRRQLTPTSLSSLHFAVIGLGDSSYLKYNFVAKKLHKRLLNLGGHSVRELALGDDQHDHGPFAKIDPWLKDFYSIIISATDDDESDTEDLFEPSAKFTFLDTEEQQEIDGISEEQTRFDSLNPYEANVSSNTRVTAQEHFQDVRLMSLNVSPPFHYELGDVCSVYPQNSDQDVETFLKLFEAPEYRNPNRLFTLELTENHWIPQSSFYHHLLAQRNPCSVGEFIKTYLDITALPKRSFFYLFYRFSRNDLERTKLKSFAEGSDLDELYEYVNRPRRTILEVMADFPHTTPYVPFGYLPDLIPAIAARPYSIASSPARDPGQIDLLYAVVNYVTRLRKPRLGLCTNWMASLGPDDRVRIFVRPSNFRLPGDHSGRPLIMVGAGTGVAPFRAFIHDRAHISREAANWLFFGCRYRQADYYLEEEWQVLRGQGLLTVYEAFSRENAEASKVYVQHRLWDQREAIYRLLMEQHGLLWIAGKSQQYPQLVRETLCEILKDQMGETDDKKVEGLVNQLELKKRIQFECW